MFPVLYAELIIGSTRGRLTECLFEAAREDDTGFIASMQYDDGSDERHWIVIRHPDINDGKPFWTGTEQFMLKGKHLCQAVIKYGARVQQAVWPMNTQTAQVLSVIGPPPVPSGSCPVGLPFSPGQQRRPRMK